ncbi:MAG: Uma2 family endonuclease [Chloroflexota bacterium]
MSSPDVAASTVSPARYVPTIGPLPKPLNTAKNGSKEAIFYPESDGMPMAEHMDQYDYLTLFKGSMEIQYEDDSNVLIAGDVFWYPVEGNPKIKYAPDVMVIFGRPKYNRGSYLQWKEENIPPHIVFEIWSPGNSKVDKDKKFAFYQRYGVEEYYTYDPHKGELEGWLRAGQQLKKISKMNGWRSPRLGITFSLHEKELAIYDSQGNRYLSHEDEGVRRRRTEAERDEAIAERDEAIAERDEAVAKARDEAEARAQMEEEIRRLKESLKQAGFHS